MRMQWSRWVILGLCCWCCWLWGCARTLPLAPPEIKAKPIVTSQTKSGQPRWYYEATSQIVSTPALGLNTIYITSLDRKLIAIDTTTGKPQWIFKTSGLIKSSPVLSPNGLSIYVAAQDHNIYALSTNTGNQLWDFPTQGPIDAAPTLDVSGILYVSSSDARVYALEPPQTSKQKRATTKWIYNATEQFKRSAPTLSPAGDMLYVGSLNGMLHAIPTLQTSHAAQPQWIRKICHKITSTATVDTNGIIYIGCWGRYPSGSAANQQQGELKAVHPNGTVLWSFPTGGPILATPQIGKDGTIYIGSDDSWFYAIHPNGTKKWAFRSGTYVRTKGKMHRVDGSESFIQASAAINPQNGNLYFGSSNEHLYGLSALGMLLWQVDLRGWVDHAPLVVGRGELLYAVAGQRLFALNP